MGSLTQHQTILWREMMATVNNGYSPTIYIATAKRRAALAAIDKRLEELEALAKQIAETEPIIDVTGEGDKQCYYCDCWSGDPHADDCIWNLVQEVKEK